MVTLHCVVVELELNLELNHDCGPDCPCWTMKSIDTYLDRVPRQDYNCLDFVREVWLDLFGSDVKDRLDAICRAVSAGSVPASPMHGFERLARPASPCFVVFQRRRQSPHVGIYMDRRVLHLCDNGVEFQLLDVVKKYFNLSGIRFYR